ncbi:hypothetical protein BGZ68_010965 [Mortierella alpina]|nr:hypothetical protein BGZ68_010965 [Mortierella alpina]
MAWGGGNANNIDSWVKRLQENDASFTSLHILSFRRITSAELGRVFEAITHNSTLKEFYASGHALDQDAAHKLALALEHNRTLERLNVGHDGLGSDEAVFKILAEGLSKSQAPLRLDLENKGLGSHETSVSALAAALEKNQALQELNLARNKLTDQDIATLCKSLAQNRSVQKLDLCLNSFSEVGTRTVAELLAGQNDPNTPGLKEIDLSDNELTEEGGTAIGKALETNQQLERLRMSSCMDPPLPVEEGDEDKLQWDHEIHELNVRLTPEQEAEIRSDGDTVLEAIATALKQNQTLQELWMDYCNISSIGATFLASALRHNHGLTTVRMRNNRVGNRGARSIGAALTPTGSASLAAGAVGLEEKEEVATGYNTALKNLELGSNKVGVLGWHGLVGASSLESLGLFENGINVLHEALENHVISNLSPISSPPLPNPAAPVSASVPNGSSTARHVLENLIHLDVGCNGISRESFTQLGVCLIKGVIPSLMRLEIAGNGSRAQVPPQHPGQGDPEESGPDDDEQNAWETVATRIEEARPGLTVHWKGAGAMQQQP